MQPTQDKTKPTVSDSIIVHLLMMRFNLVSSPPLCIFIPLDVGCCKTVSIAVSFTLSTKRSDRAEVNFATASNQISIEHQTETVACHHHPRVVMLINWNWHFLSCFPSKPITTSFRQQSDNNANKKALGAFLSDPQIDTHLTVDHLITHLPRAMLLLRWWHIMMWEIKWGTNMYIRTY